MSCLAPLLTRTQNYAELDDIHDEDPKLVGVNAGVDSGEGTQQLAVPDASTGTKVLCDEDNCPGRNF